MVTLANINAFLPGWQLVILGFLLFIFVASGIWFIIWQLNKKRWPIKVMILHKNIKSQGSHIAGWDRARRIGLLRTGEEIYYWKKRKKYRVGNEIYVSPNPPTMAWARGQRDGYYRNIGFDNVDNELRKMGIVPTDIEARTMSGLVDEAIQKRHDARTFLEKWAVPITIIMLIIAIGVQAGGQVWAQHVDNKGKAQEVIVAQTNKETAQLSKETLTAIANLRAGGSGIIPA